MGILFDRFDVAPIKGENITIGDCGFEFFISETDGVFYYPGMCLYDEERRGRASFMHPYYMRGKHSKDKIVTQEVKGFYRIVDSCIVLDKFVDDCYYSDGLYKKIVCGVRLASPASCDYGVFVNREEDEELTRKVFGLTYYELTELLEAYAKMMGTNHDYFTYPKLTRSIQNTNFCDITGCWIPETFPYVAFNESSLNDELYAYKLSSYCSNEGNIYTESLGGQAYKNNPRFNKFIKDNELSFEPYEKFGKDEIEKRNKLVAQLVKLVWNTSMFE